MSRITETLPTIVDELSQRSQSIALTAHDTRQIRNSGIKVTEQSALLNCKMGHMSRLREALHNRSLIVDCLSMLFGVVAWIGVNSMFLQLPIFVESAPEKWSLPSYLVVMVQLGNLGPLLYTSIQNLLPKKLNDAYIIYVVLAVGTVASLLTAFFYDKTAVIGGNSYSVALFVLVFFLSLNSCTSSVLFMPYMGRFKEIYLITYLTGEGLSGLLPSVVALIQGVGGKPECIPLGNNTFEVYYPPPRFGSMEFFLFVFSFMLCGAIAFTLLDNLGICKREHAPVKVSHGNSYEYSDDSENRNNAEANTAISSSTYTLLLILIGVISMLANGIFFSIQSYSCLPYGRQAYHLTATLSAIANPVACFLAVFLPHTSLKSILSLSGCAAILTTYVFVTALLSPTPPLVGTTGGIVLIIMVWTLLIGIVSYTKLSITSLMRSQGGKSLVWVGGLTQLGSTIGSIVIFVLIKYTHMFVDVDVKPC